MPTISVIIPAYNQSQYLGESIQSVLGQTYADFELVVVDDGSTDGTAEVVDRFTDPRILYIYQQNQGLSAARNTGIRSSTGSLLTFLDADDLFLPGKLEILAKFLADAPETGFVAGQAIPIDDQGRQVGRVFDKPLPEGSWQLLLGNPFHVGSVLLQRSWQERVGFFDENLRSYEDWDLWLRLALVGCPLGYIPEPVSLYRFHPAQMTRISNQMTRATFMVLEKIYARSDLPGEWHAAHSIAYSRAHLRAAAQSYLSGDYESGKVHLSKAVALDPALTAQDAQPLASHFSAWTDLPKTRDPLAFLKGVYDHLPEHLEFMMELRNGALGQAALKMAFEANAQGDRTRARAALLHAFRYQPSWIGNRGALSIFVRSLLTLSRS